jgi:hypothetical protein
MNYTTGTLTYGTGNATTTSFRPPHHCRIRRTHAKGNQHLRIEYGVCECGRKYSRTIRWAERDARRWWEQVAR